MPIVDSVINLINQMRGRMCLILWVFVCVCVCVCVCGYWVFVFLTLIVNVSCDDCVYIHFQSI